MIKVEFLDKDEYEFVCDLINQRLFDLEDGETKHPKTDEGRQVEAKKLQSALDKLVAMAIHQIKGAKQ